MKRELLEKVLNANKNLIVNGDLSVGKTSNILLPIVDKIIDKNESLLIIDNKEEYLNNFYDKLKSKNYNIIIVNFKDLDKSEGWNPLYIPYKSYKSGESDLALEYLERFGKIMFHEAASNDPFWSMTASDFFTGVTLGLFEDGKENEVNLNSVNMMFNGIDKKFGVNDYITEYFKMKDSNKSSYICASTTFLAPKETKCSILSVARQRLRVLISREKLSSMLSKTTFDLEKIFNIPTAIFVIGKEEQSTYNSLLSIFVDQLFHELYLNSKQKYSFILDNIDSIEYIDGFSEMLSSGVARGIKSYIGTRSLENLNEKYGTYINKLCNIVNVFENKIKLINNDIEYEKSIFEYRMSNVEYPSTINDSISLFNIEDFVKKNKEEMLSGMENDNIQPLADIPKNGWKVDDLIKRIDDKIAELDKTEESELKNNKSKNEKSE